MRGCGGAASAEPMRAPRGGTEPMEPGFARVPPPCASPCERRRWLSGGVASSAAATAASAADTAASVASA
eukprot:scaffold18219_cov36-Phaeocystis_antarctica.AAC.1